MRHWVTYVLVAIVAAAVGAGIALYFVGTTRVEVAVGETRGELLSRNAPAGTLTTETNAAYKGAAPPAAAAGTAPAAAAGDWPSYNKTLTSERFSSLSQINTQNVAKLKVLCSYDARQFTSFETGPIMVAGALIGTTEFDIFSLDPATCAENWRTHEDYPGYILPTNRGAAYLDGMLFRGTGDGRVLAYDFKTGQRLWETTIADQKGRSRARRADCLERSCVRRQRGRRLQGRKRAHVCARRQDRQHRLGILSRAQIRGGHDPRASGHVATRQFDLEERARCADQRRRSLDSCDFGSCSGAPVCPLGNPAPDFDIGAREGENLFTDSVVVLDAKTGA